MNSLGYKLKKVKKVQPLKKLPQTDQIFQNISQVKKTYLNDNDAAIISIDAKNAVNIGNFSRGGYSRANVKAMDHDFCNNKLTPFGILDVKSDVMNFYNTTSKVTADFIVDAIEDYWKISGYQYTKKTLVILMDNGPENSSRRTRFIYKMLLLADIYKIKIVLAYYPPYHSKYNPVERLWARLENIWNGSILDSVETCIKFMKNLTWKSKSSNVKLVEKEYETGIKESKITLDKFEKYITRIDNIEEWALTICTIWKKLNIR